MSTSDKPQHQTGTAVHHRAPTASPPLPVAFWQQRYSLTDHEVQALRKAAVQYARHRQWAETKELGAAWTEPCALDVLASEGLESRRQDLLLTLVSDAAEEIDGIPEAIDAERQPKPTANQAEGKFRRLYTEKDLTDHLRKLAVELGHAPTFTDLKNADGPAPDTYYYRFGSMVAAQKAAGLIPNDAARFDGPAPLPDNMREDAA